MKILSEILPEGSKDAGISRCFVISFFWCLIVFTVCLIFGTVLFFVLLDYQIPYRGIERSHYEEVLDKFSSGGFE